MALVEHCKTKGITIAGEYCDIISGSKESRTGLDSMLEACERGEIGRIITVRIDRVSRSLSGFVRLIDRLTKLNVALTCPGQGIDTDSEKAEGSLLRNILAVLAEFERELIRQRTKDGITAAKARGAICGRPSVKLSKDWPAIVSAWRKEPTGYLDLARRLGGVSTATAWRLVKKSDSQAG